MKPFARCPPRARVLGRDRTSGECTERDKLILRSRLKGLWRLESPEAAAGRASWRPWAEMILWFKSKGLLLAEFFLAQWRSVFVLLRPSTDWMGSTHVIGGNLLYSLIKMLISCRIALTKTSRVMFNQTSGRLLRWVPLLPHLKLRAVSGKVDRFELRAHGDLTACDLSGKHPPLRFGKSESSNHFCDPSA